MWAGFPLVREQAWTAALAGMRLWFLPSANVLLLFDWLGAGWGPPVGWISPVK